MNHYIHLAAIILVILSGTDRAFGAGTNCPAAKRDPARSMCRVTRAQYAGHQEFILENDLIRVSVLPTSSGKILNYVFKTTGQQLFQPLDEEILEFADPPLVIKSNYAGYKDMIWERGFNPSSKVYLTKEIVEKPDRCAIEVCWTCREYTLTRRVSICRDTTEVRVDVTMTSTADEPQTLSYWSQTPMFVADPSATRPTQIVPVRHVEKKQALRGRAFYEGASVILAQTVPKGSVNYPPAQPWWALQDPKTRLIVGQVFPSVEDFGPDGFFYSCSTGSLLTQEPVFAQRTFAKGQSRQYALSFVTVDGLGEPAYLSRNLALQILTPPRGQYKQGASMDVAMKMASPRCMAKAAIELVLVDTNGNVHKLGQSQEIALSPLQGFDVIFNVPVQIAPGRYDLGVRLAVGGEMVETVTLVGRSIEVQP